MRLLLVSSCHHPSQGGIGTAVWWFVHFAVRAGWRIELITRPGHAYPPGAVIHEVRTPDDGADFVNDIPALRRIERIRPYRYGLWSRAVAQRLLELPANYDAVEFVDSRAEGFVALTSRRVRERWGDVPTYLRAHSPMFLIERLSGQNGARFGREIYHGWEQAALAAADGVLCPSLLLREALELAAPAAVVPPFIGPQSEFHGRSCRKLLLLIGTVDANKGPDVWAQSLNVVLRRHADATAALVGPDTFTAPDGGSMAAHVQSLLEPNLRRRFHWKGAASHEHALHMVDDAAMVVVPSRFESFSYVGAEAIMSGCPVVFSKHVGITECVPAARVVNYGDANALASAQDEALADPRSARDAASHCRYQLQCACKPADLLRRTEDFIESLTVRPRHSHDQDSIDAMTGFLEETEAAARAFNPASLLAVSSDKS